MKQAVVIAGLAFGDEGKGVLTDSLTRIYQAELVVRYNGGPQAAHNVVTPEGVHHTFSQFGSGTLAGARTFLSKYMLVEPLALWREAEALRSKGIHRPQSLVTIDPDCVLVTPWHRLANQLRETARESRHGSVGLGIGEARADELAGYAVRVRDIWAYATAEPLRVIRGRKLDEMAPLASAGPEIFRRMIETSVIDVLQRWWDILGSLRCAEWRDVASEADAVIFEGAQGVLLDEVHGFAPYNTWTDCTFGNANSLLSSFPDVSVMRVGVLRSYFTRHGAGPFVTESSTPLCPEFHNGNHPFMGAFRTGYFDAVAAKYALQCTGNQVDCLALTHLDRIPSNQICLKYEDEAEPMTAEALFRARPRYQSFEDVTEAIEGLLGVPLHFGAYGPQATGVQQLVRAGKGGLAK